MKQGVSDSQTPAKGCIRSPESERRSFKFMDSWENRSVNDLSYTNTILK